MRIDACLCNDAISSCGSLACQRIANSCQITGLSFPLTGPTNRVAHAETVATRRINAESIQGAFEALERGEEVAIVIDFNSQ